MVEWAVVLLHGLKVCADALMQAFLECASVPLAVLILYFRGIE